MLRSEELRDALISLHRVKTHAYGTAWKKRGEVLSILANIARKVDRIEFVSDRGIATADESLLDTHVDLLVYAMKYQTFLADEDDDIAKGLGLDTAVGRPYSDGFAGFDHLASQLDLRSMGIVNGDAAPNHEEISRAFSAIEACFAGLTANAPRLSRLSAAQRLVRAAVDALAVHAEREPDEIRSLHRACWQSGRGRCSRMTI